MYLEESKKFSVVSTRIIHQLWWWHFITLWVILSKTTSKVFWLVGIIVWFSDNDTLQDQWWSHSIIGSSNFLIWYRRTPSWFQTWKKNILQCTSLPLCIWWYSNYLLTILRQICVNPKIFLQWCNVNLSQIWRMKKHQDRWARLQFYIANF